MGLYFTAGMIVKLRWKGGDPSKARTIQRVDPARGFNRGFSCKSTFVAPIERVTLGLNAPGSPFAAHRLGGTGGLGGLFV